MPQVHCASFSQKLQELGVFGPNSVWTENPHEYIYDTQPYFSLFHSFKNKNRNPLKYHPIFPSKSLKCKCFLPYLVDSFHIQVFLHDFIHEIIPFMQIFKCSQLHQEHTLVFWAENTLLCFHIVSIYLLCLLSSKDT